MAPVALTATEDTGTTAPKGRTSPKRAAPKGGERVVAVRKTDGVETRRVALHLPREIARQLAVYAAAVERDQSAVVAELIEQRVREAGIKIPRALKDQGDSSA